MTSTALRRARTAGLLLSGVLIAAALGAGAAAMADGVRAQAPQAMWPVTPPSPRSASPRLAAPAVVPVAEPSAPESSAPAAPPRPLDMRTVDPRVTADIVVPAGLASCPAGTARLRAGKASGYAVAGEATVAYADVTGDGPAELVLALRCGERGQALLVLGASGPRRFRTVAAADLGSAADLGAAAGLGAAAPVVRVSVAAGVITTYDETGADVRTWGLRHGALAQLGAPAAPIDWRSATLALPAFGTCAAGTYTLANGVLAHRLAIPVDARIVRAEFAGPRDALFSIDCVAGGGPGVRALVAVHPTGPGAGRVLAVLAQVPAPGRLVEYGIAGGIVRVVSAQVDPATGATTSTTATYRWSGGAFVPLS